MSQKCSKCGAETNYISDLHCREILQSKTRELLLCGKIEAAEQVISRGKFSEEWKQIMRQKLFSEPEVRQKLQEIWQKKEFVLLQAQNQFSDLAKKYKLNIDQIVNWSGPTPLAPILIKINDGEMLSENELNWLEYHRIFELLAEYYYGLSKDSPIGDAWSLSKASKFFQKAGMAEKAIKITDNFDERNTIDFGADSAVYTSRGAAFRRLSDLNSARECVGMAIALSSYSFHPYNLLGGICYDEGNPKEGDIYFKKAIDMGSNPKAKDNEIKNILNGSSDPEIKKTIIDYLIKKDPEKYSWTKQFNL